MPDPGRTAVTVYDWTTTVHPEWERRHRVAEQTMLPWLESFHPLAGKRVLEYGCGQGAVSVALGRLAAEVVAVDIDADELEIAHKRLAATGVRTVQATCHPPDRIMDEVRARGGDFDVVLFYAVLEHMTIDERLRALELAAELTAPGGVIVVIETPNRLIAHDGHSSLLPFYNQLPDELALAYFERSPREDFKETIREASSRGSSAALEALVRFGRGMSYHEFELVFGDLSRHVVSSSYEPRLGQEREVHREELALARLLERVAPELPAAFSRFWLDLVISPTPVKAPPAIRPWTMDTSISQGVTWTGQESLGLPSPEAVVNVELPVATRRLVIASQAEPERWDIAVRVPETGASVQVAVQRPEAGNAWVSVDLPAPAASLHVAMSHRGYISFLGYER